MSDVVDPQGVNVTGAEISVLNTASQRVGGAKSGPDGTFSVPGIAPGTYVLRIEAPGFQTVTQNIVVSANTPPVNAVLQIAALTENVAVVAPNLEEELPQESWRRSCRRK
jgi:hypothetical protein